MNTATKRPYIPKDLLEWLDTKVREESPIPGKPLDVLMFEGGKRELVRWLWIQYADQERNAQANGLVDIKLK